MSILYIVIPVVVIILLFVLPSKKEEPETLDQTDLIKRKEIQKGEW